MINQLYCNHYYGWQSEETINMTRVKAQERETMDACVLRVIQDDPIPCLVKSCKSLAPDSKTLGLASLIVPRKPKRYSQPHLLI